MTEPSNPYRPPTSFVQDVATPSTSEGGNLEDALAGRIKLDPMAAARQAWEAVGGVKLTVFAASLVLTIPLTLVMLAVFAAFLWPTIAAGGMDVTALSLEFAAIATTPTYLLTAGLLIAPANALLYLGFWKLGLRRAAGVDTTLGDAFALDSLLPGTLLFFGFVPFNLLSSVNPLFSYITLPIWIAILWVFPMLVDRGAPLGEALSASLKLFGHNVAATFGLGLILLVGYVAAILTCGIGLFWFLPFASNLFGFAWKQLAGLDRMA